MSDTWVLLAGGAGARLFDVPGNGTVLTEIACYTHTKGWVLGRRPAHHRFAEMDEFLSRASRKINAHMAINGHNAGRFADMLRDEMARGREAGFYQRLVLVAPSWLLGVLRQRLDVKTLECVVAEVPGDMLSLSGAELFRFIEAQVRASF